MSRANMASARMTDHHLQHHKANVYISANRTPPSGPGIPFFALATSALRRLFPQIPGPLYSEDPDVPALYITISPDKPTHPNTPYMSMPVTFDTVADQKHPSPYKSPYGPDVPSERHLPRGPTVPSQHEVDLNQPRYNSPYGPDDARHALPPRHHLQQHHAYPPQTYKSPYPPHAHPPSQQLTHDPTTRRPSDPTNPTIAHMHPPHHGSRHSVPAPQPHNQAHRSHPSSPLAQQHFQRHPQPPASTTSLPPRAPDQSRRVSFASISDTSKGYNGTRAPLRFRPPVVGPSPASVHADQLSREPGMRQEPMPRPPIPTPTAKSGVEPRAGMQTAFKSPAERNDAMRVDSPFQSHATGDLLRNAKHEEQSNVAKSPALPSPTASTSDESVRSAAWNRPTAWVRNTTDSTPGTSQATSPMVSSAAPVRGISFRALSAEDQIAARNVFGDRITPGFMEYWASFERKKAEEQRLVARDQPPQHKAKDSPPSRDRLEQEIRSLETDNQPVASNVQTVDLTIDEREHEEPKVDSVADDGDAHASEGARDDHTTKIPMQTSPTLSVAEPEAINPQPQPVAIEIVHIQPEMDAAQQISPVEPTLPELASQESTAPTTVRISEALEDFENSMPLSQARKAHRKLDAPSFATRQDVHLKDTDDLLASETTKDDTEVDISDDSAIHLPVTITPNSPKQTSTDRIAEEDRTQSSTPARSFSARILGKRKREADPELDSEPAWTWKVQKVTWNIEQDDAGWLDEIVAEL